MVKYHIKLYPRAYRDMEEIYLSLIHICLGRGYDHTTLSLTDRAYQIHDSHSHAAAGSLHLDALIREDRRHILECHSLG